MDMSKAKIEIPAPIPSVQMPSADLINFRFDQSDRKTDEISSKLDTMSETFATKEELRAVHKRLDNWIKYGWSMFITALVIIGGLIAAYIEKGK